MSTQHGVDLRESRRRLASALLAIRETLPDDTAACDMENARQSLCDVADIVKGFSEDELKEWTKI